MARRCSCFTSNETEAYTHISFIGAPITNMINKEPYTYVGNGGLSLRKVQDHLTVLRSKPQIKEPKWYTRSTVKKNRPHIFEIYKQLPIARRTLVNYNEDFFWCCINNHPNYKVASIELALEYAREINLTTQNLADSKYYHLAATLGKSLLVQRIKTYFGSYNVMANIKNDKCIIFEPYSDS